MLTASTSNTSRHSETRQSQAGRSPGLARHLFDLPPHILPEIWSFIPSEKAALASDLFEKRSNEKKDPDSDLQLLLLNRSILREEREAFLLKALAQSNVDNTQSDFSSTLKSVFTFLLKALTQPNVDNAQSDFSSILNPVFTEGHPAPYLPRLLEVAAYGNKSIPFDRLIETVRHTKTSIPESTYEWVAECGKPEVLNKLLVKIQPALPRERQKELKKLAQAQKKAIQRYSEFTLPQRQQKLRIVAQGLGQRTAIEKRREVLALLQTPDIDVNAVNGLGDTVLHRAAQRGETETVNLLLKVPDIDVNAANQDGETPLHLALAGGHTEIMNALLEAPGVDVNAANRPGHTALHRAALNGRTETVNALLGTPGINVNAANRFGDTALHLSARNGRTETVNALLGAPGINVNAANCFGHTALHWAAEFGLTETVNALLQAPGIDVNTVDNNSSTALHLAAENGRTETVNALLGAPGIDVNAANERGVRPLQLAVRERHAEIANALRQAGDI
jgi:ankyrin repeat protein